MIYRNFLLFKMDRSTKIELRQKMKFAQNLVLYSSTKFQLIKKNFSKKKNICTKKI